MNSCGCSGWTPPAPPAYGDNCATLEITLQDPALEVKVRLLYTVFEDVDAICRSVRIENGGTAPVELSAALSASPARLWTPGPKTIRVGQQNSKAFIKIDTILFRFLKV